jgi:primary-amine oxidase
MFLLIALLVTIAQAAPHPLDPLNAKEVASAVSALRKAGRLGPNARLPYLLLKEPPKQEVLDFKPGAKFARRAEAVVYDRAAKKLFEATIDAKAGRIEDIHEVPGMQPSVMLSEFEDAPKIVRADPRFSAAVAKRGIRNPDEVAVDVWAYGSPDSELSRRTRLLRAICYYKGKGKNFYARPIEGLTFIVNMDERRVERVIDTVTLPVPPVVSEIRKPGKSALKPLIVSQPQGPSFRVEGQEVRWQNWAFRFQMHPREGLVLYQVRYLDHGRWRQVLYRASLAEMMVPYGHNDDHWTWRAAFDEGEYGIGRYSGSLEVGTDVPPNARLFDALFVDDFGMPYSTKNAVALYERDGGLLWKHFDMYAGGNVSRRGRDLVIGFITTISNYDYGLNWVFREDGSLELEAQLTGIMLTKGASALTMTAAGHGHADDGAPTDLTFGHLVAPHVVAPRPT